MIYCLPALKFTINVIASLRPTNQPNCSVNFYASTASSSDPATSILQCSPTLAHGTPQPAFKYVLCKKISGDYYWAKLMGDNITPTFEQAVPVTPQQMTKQN